jgi:hypothetical protein
VYPSLQRRRFRTDAAFAIPELFELLEDEGWDYAIRIKGNPKLHVQIEPPPLNWSASIVRKAEDPRWL